MDKVKEIMEKAMEPGAEPMERVRLCTRKPHHPLNIGAVLVREGDHVALILECANPEQAMVMQDQMVARMDQDGYLILRVFK